MGGRVSRPRQKGKGRSLSLRYLRGKYYLFNDTGQNLENFFYFKSKSSGYPENNLKFVKALVLTIFREILRYKSSPGIAIGHVPILKKSIIYFSTITQINYNSHRYGVRAPSLLFSLSRPKFCVDFKKWH